MTSHLPVRFKALRTGAAGPARDSAVHAQLEPARAIGDLMPKVLEAIGAAGVAFYRGDCARATDREGARVALRTAHAIELAMFDANLPLP